MKTPAYTAATEAVKIAEAKASIAYDAYVAARDAAAYDAPAVANAARESGAAYAAAYAARAVAWAVWDTGAAVPA